MEDSTIELLKTIFVFIVIPLLAIIANYLKGILERLSEKVSEHHDRILILETEKRILSALGDSKHTTH